MVALSVGGRGCWRKEDGWLWLRIVNKGCLLLDQCLVNERGWKKEVHVELQDLMNQGITVEIWSGESHSTDFLQFVMGWTMDLAQWIQTGAAKRWYEVKKAGQDIANGPEYCESEVELQSTTTYVFVGIVGAQEDPAVESSELPQLTKEVEKKSKSTFQFVLPHRSLARSSKFRAVRVGRIVHELRTDVLHDLLPLTLYGRGNRHHQRSSSHRLKDPHDGVVAALVLLQLSCQYANYCVGELDRYSSKLESRHAKLQGKINRLQHRQSLQKEQKATLQRKTEMLSCSLDGMQSILQQLDPETLARLQDEGNAGLQKEPELKLSTM